MNTNNTNNTRRTTQDNAKWTPNTRTGVNSTSGRNRTNATDDRKRNTHTQLTTNRREADSHAITREGDPREHQLIEERAARKEAALRRKHKRQIKKLKNYIKLGVTCACIGVFLAVFVFKTPIERGTKELKSGNYQEAIEEFSKGLSEIDYIAESYKGIGIAYYELAQYKDAIDNLESAIQKGQTTQGTTYYLLAISYMEIGDYSNALDNIIIALTKSGNGPELIQELRYNEVLCMELTSDWEGAKAKATSYIQSYPDDESMKLEYKFLASR